MSGKSHKNKKSHKKTHHQDHVDTPDEVIEVAATPIEENPEQTIEEEIPVRADFPYSDVVRTYVPDAMAVADKVVMDWKSEGSFMNLGIENQYANMAVALGLQNAKKIEKKLEEKGVLPLVRMGFEVIKTKVNKQK
jgi:hypothetical protein